MILHLPERSSRRECWESVSCSSWRKLRKPIVRQSRAHHTPQLHCNLLATGVRARDIDTFTLQTVRVAKVWKLHFWKVQFNFLDTHIDRYRCEKKTYSILLAAIPLFVCESIGLPIKSISSMFESEKRSARELSCVGRLDRVLLVVASL